MYCARGAQASIDGQAWPSMPAARQNLDVAGPGGSDGMGAIVLFCSDPVSPHQIDSDYQVDRTAAQASGSRTTLVNYEAIVNPANVGCALRRAASQTGSCAGDLPRLDAASGDLRRAARRARAEECDAHQRLRRLPACARGVGVLPGDRGIHAGDDLSARGVR